MLLLPLNDEHIYHQDRKAMLNWNERVRAMWVWFRYDQLQTSIDKNKFRVRFLLKGCVRQWGDKFIACTIDESMNRVFVSTDKVREGLGFQLWAVHETKRCRSSSPDHVWESTDREESHTAQESVSCCGHSTSQICVPEACWEDWLAHLASHWHRSSDSRCG